MKLNDVVFPDGAIFNSVQAPYDTDVPIFANKHYVSGEFRDTIRMTLVAAYNEIANRFVPGAHWAVRQYDMTPEGLQLDTYTDYDKSDYTVCGDIVDHRDGRVTVYMGKPTESELLRDTVDELILMTLGV